MECNLSRTKIINFSTPFFIIRRKSNSVMTMEFNSASEMDEAISNIVVSYGEDGKRDDIIYQSYDYIELQSIIHYEKESKEVD